MQNNDVRSLIGAASSGGWRKLAHAETSGQAVCELHQYVNGEGVPQSLYRTVYGLEQRDWDNAVSAQESFQHSVLHQWDCAGFND